ncbi:MULTISPECIES: hypothetical protein [Streptomyces]|uniref:hypothetical protein n=1 Tax=Streptomyces TaxID=1883 RepID=UPI0004CDAC65|nr:MULTISPECIES: hypothetical protein [Streptomyces]
MTRLTFERFQLAGGGGEEGLSDPSGDDVRARGVRTVVAMPPFFALIRQPSAGPDACSAT